MAKSKRVPVTERALLQRINRKLKPESELIRKKRGRLGEGLQDLGLFYRVDLNRNALLDRDVNLNRLARELGVLADWEELVQ